MNGTAVGSVMLDPAVTALAKGQNFAAFTTLMPGGQPQTHVMWVDCDDTHVLINTEAHRQKARNVAADSRVTVCLIENGTFYNFVEVRGHVDEVVRGPEARAHIDALSMKYMGQPYGREVESERVILRIAPDRVVTR